MSKGIVLRIPPALATALRDTYKELRRTQDAKDRTSLRQEILDEVCNLPDRWCDLIANRDEKEEADG